MITDHGKSIRTPSSLPPYVSLSLAALLPSTAAASARLMLTSASALSPSSSSSSLLLRRRRQSRGMHSLMHVFISRASAVRTEEIVSLLFFISFYQRLFLSSLHGLIDKHSRCTDDLHALILIHAFRLFAAFAFIRLGADE